MPDQTLFDLYRLPEWQKGEPTAPYQRHSPTSKAAAVSVASTACQQRERVYEYLESQGAKGATDLEIQGALGLDGSSERPRRVELVAAGRIHDTGRRRPTKSGRLAVVYCVTLGACT